jgi:O-antigen/teichoic acid export membrane protein
MSQLKKGALLSYVTIILTNGVGLLLTPFMIRTLGDSEYGLYMLVGAIISYISVLDFGLTNTIVRYIARYRATQDRPGEENFLATTMILYGVISALVALAGIAICFNHIQPSHYTARRRIFGNMFGVRAFCLSAVGEYCQVYRTIAYACGGVALGRRFGFGRVVGHGGEPACHRTQRILRL